MRQKNYKLMKRTKTRMSPLQQEAAPTLLFVFSSYQTCWRHNGRWVLTTSSDGRAQFSTVNNTCGVTTVELCWPELWSDNVSNRIGRINSLFEHIFIIIFICSDKNTWCLFITCTFTCKHLKFTRNIYMMFIYDLYIYLTPQWYTSWAWGRAYQETTFRTKIGSGPG